MALIFEQLFLFLFLDFKDNCEKQPPLLTSATEEGRRCSTIISIRNQVSVFNQRLKEASFIIALWDWVNLPLQTESDIPDFNATFINRQTMYSYIHTY